MIIQSFGNEVLEIPHESAFFITISSFLLPFPPQTCKESKYLVNRCSTGVPRTTRILNTTFLYSSD